MKTWKKKWYGTGFRWSGAFAFGRTKDFRIPLDHGAARGSNIIHSTVSAAPPMAESDKRASHRRCVPEKESVSHTERIPLVIPSPVDHYIHCTMTISFALNPQPLYCLYVHLNCTQPWRSRAFTYNFRLDKNIFRTYR